MLELDYQSDKKLLLNLSKNIQSLKDKIKNKKQVLSLLKKRSYSYNQSLFSNHFKEKTEQAMINRGLAKLDGFALSLLIVFIASITTFSSLISIDNGSLSLPNKEDAELLGLSLVGICLSTMAFLFNDISQFMSYSISNQNKNRSYLFTPLKLIIQGVFKGELSLAIPALRRRIETKELIKKTEDDIKTLKSDLRNTRDRLFDKEEALKNDNAFITALKNEYQNFGDYKKVIFGAFLKKIN